MWQAIGASVQGTGHVRQGLPCQDACHWQVADEYLVAAVGDGLGSAPHADLGARLAVETAVAHLATHLTQSTANDAATWQHLMQGAYAQARSQLAACAEEASQPLKAYATTLLVLAATPEWLAVGHIGDGAIVVRFADGRLETVSPPVNGEYVNSVTPLTADDFAWHIRVRVEPAAVMRAALLTDGIQSLCINLATMTPYRPFFTPFFAALDQELNSSAISAEVAHFLESERICTKTDDDKTLVVIGRLPVSRPADDVGVSVLVL
jgi:hypothetical protein